MSYLGFPFNKKAALTRLCLTTTYFQFGGDFYEQVEGAAMDSPLSPVVANINMQGFAQRALTATIGWSILPNAL